MDDIIQLFIWFWVIAIGGTLIFAIGSVIVAIISFVIGVALPIIVVIGIFGFFLSIGNPA